MAFTNAVRCANTATTFSTDSTRLAHSCEHTSDTYEPVATTVFRANPYPEVTDLICRLPLPTLFYRLETLNLGDLLRIRVQAIGNFACPFHRFSRANERIPTQQFNVMLYQSVTPYLSMKDFHGAYDCKTEKKTLSISPIDVSMRASRCRDVEQSRKRGHSTNVYPIGYGIGTVFPFALC
jgi:hypothetical protein